MNYEIIRATESLLERIWACDIAKNPDDPRWIDWRREYIDHNLCGRAITYLVLADGEPVGQGTLLISPECSAIAGRLDLCDGTRVANVNALRIEKAHEGKGLISRLVRELEITAHELGFEHVTIGVEARETRNLAIYLHWGYTSLVRYCEEDGELVLYYAKTLGF